MITADHCMNERISPYECITIWQLRNDLQRETAVKRPCHVARRHEDAGEGAEVHVIRNEGNQPVPRVSVLLGKFTHNIGIGWTQWPTPVRS